MFEVEMGRGEIDWRRNEKTGQTVFQVSGLPSRSSQRTKEGRSKLTNLPSFPPLVRSAHQRQPPLLTHLLLNTKLQPNPPLLLPNHLLLSPHPPSDAVLSSQVPRRRRRGRDPRGRDWDRYVFAGAATGGGGVEVGGRGEATSCREGGELLSDHR